jgi:hypothetical protein
MTDETPERSEPEQGVGETVRGLLRFGASAWWHTAEGTVQTSARVARRLLGAAASSEEAAGLASDMSEVARSAARDLASVGGVGERVMSAVPEGSVAERVASAAADVARPRSERSTNSLADLGAELLSKSRDVNYDAQAHPAYERIIQDLAPDEGRILRLLFLGGPQPAVDVRTGGPIGLINSRLIASGFTMIGPRAGLRHVDQVPSYLNNLFRLGMIWFSRETLHDPLPYQVVEAQPEVLEAMHSIRFPRIVRRSIHLTPFGADFCRDCLSIEQTEELPEHSAPEENAGAGLPPTPEQ